MLYFYYFLIFFLSCMFMVPNTISEFIGYNFTKPNYNGSMKSEKNQVMKRMRVEKEKKGTWSKLLIIQTPCRGLNGKRKIPGRQKNDANEKKRTQ